MFLFALLLGAEPQYMFAKAFGTEGWEFGHWGLSTTDGGYILFGWTGTPSNFDDLIIKLDEMGNPIWQKIFGDPALWEGGASAVSTGDSSLILVSHTQEVANGPTKILLYKIDPQGELAWAYRLKASGDQEPYGTVPVEDGFVFCGDFTRDTLSPAVGLLVKIDEDGNVLWAKVYADGELKLWEVVQGADGSLYSIGKRGNAWALLKTDSQGSFLWAKAYPFSTNFTGAGLALAADGGLLLMGSTDSLGDTRDAMVLKVAEDGSVEWARALEDYPGSEGVATSALQLDSGKVLVVGTAVFEDSTPGVFFSLFSPEGEVLKSWILEDTLASWMTRFDFSLFLAPDGDVCATGGFGANNGDALFVKMNPVLGYQGCLVQDTLNWVDVGVASQDLSLQEDTLSFLVDTLDWPLKDTTYAVTDVCQTSEHPETAGPCAFPRAAMTSGGFYLLGCDQVSWVEVYSADGRLVRRFLPSGDRHFVSVKPGVYIWRSDKARGKSIVK